MRAPGTGRQIADVARPAKVEGSEKVSDFESWASEEITQLRQGTQLKVPSPYQSLFRYVGLQTKTSWELLKRTLNKSELLGATAHSLNDPYELSPVRFDDLSQLTVPRPPKFHGFDREPIDEDEPSRIKRLRTEANAFLDGKIKSARIVAFCQQSQSSLLWSHYANSYRGACLHFFARGFFQHRFRLGEVAYSQFRPIYPLSLAVGLLGRTPADRPPAEIDGVKRSESDKMLFFTKSQEWSYESEVRPIYDVRREPHIKFQSNGLASIILGPRISVEDEQRLRSIVEKSPYSTLPVRRARLSSTTFSVEMDDSLPIPAA